MAAAPCLSGRVGHEGGNWAAPLLHLGAVAMGGSQRRIRSFTASPWGCGQMGCSAGSKARMWLPLASFGLSAKVCTSGSVERCHEADANLWNFIIIRF